jgi:hypothetical protein
LLEPGRLVDKDRGLWTLRREFESRPGYHSCDPAVAGNKDSLRGWLLW